MHPLQLLHGHWTGDSCHFWAEWIWCAVGNSHHPSLSRWQVPPRSCLSDACSGHHPLHDIGMVSYTSPLFSSPLHHALYIAVMQTWSHIHSNCLMYIYTEQLSCADLRMFCCRYVDAVKPGRYGVAKPFYFPFLPSYWTGKPRRLKKKEVDSLVHTKHWISWLCFSIICVHVWGSRGWLPWVSPNTNTVPSSRLSENCWDTANCVHYPHSYLVHAQMPIRIHMKLQYHSQNQAWLLLVCNCSGTHLHNHSIYVDMSQRIIFSGRK